MKDIEPIAGVGHNNPPEEDPIDAAMAPWADTISEIENWLDGEPITNEEQEQAVDALIKDAIKCANDVEQKRKDHTQPLNKIWKDEVARWKPTTDDIARMKAGLQALVGPFKKKRHDEAKAEERRLWLEAEKAREEAAALAAVAAAEATDIEASRENDEVVFKANIEAKEAENAARAASRNKVTGLKTVHHYKVESGQEVINHIIANDLPAMQAFIKSYVENTKPADRGSIAGVKAWTTKEAKQCTI